MDTLSPKTKVLFKKYLSLFNDEGEWFSYVEFPDGFSPLRKYYSLVRDLLEQNDGYDNMEQELLNRQVRPILIKNKKLLDIE